MKQEKINGFDEKEIFKLYKYVVAYEEGGISQYNTTKSMLNEHPELSHLTDIAKLVKCTWTKDEEMRNIDFKTITNSVYQTRSRGNHLLSLLAHLRNSIAHGYVSKHEDSILITDFANPKFNPIDFTARGRIELQIIERITKILKQIEL